MEQQTFSTNDELYPLALLIDELKHDDVTLRLNAMHRLSTIALALGKDRTRQELIPFLEDVTQEDEDEVLTVLAEELGGFIPYVGGQEYAYVLIPPLEALSAVEEPVVRDKAVESLNHICGEVTPDNAEEHIVPLIKRLSSTEWFSSRVSATGLYAAAISRVTARFQQELQSLYKDLTQDDAPMVRRAAANNLPKVIEALPTVAFEGTLQQIFQSQVADDQDSVRLLSVDILIAIAEALKRQSTTKYNSDLINFTMELFNDKSWRVRYMAADRFEKLASALDSTESRERFVPAFVKLMRDSEAEVRTAISKQIPGFSALISRNVILSEIIPNVELLASDSSQHVRAALASELSRLAPLLGKDKTIEYLLPTFLQMLKDDFPDVRLNIISKLQVVNDVIGMDLLSKSLLPAISELAKDKQWRVRLAIIEYIPLLAEQLGVTFFDRELGPLCMAWLWDNVYSIREAATQNLRKLVQVFGVKWAKEEIIPDVMVVGSNSNYLFRLTALFAATTLIPVLDEDVITESILPFIVNLIDDPIPNIRFNIAKTFKVLVETFLHVEEETDIKNESQDGQAGQAGQAETPVRHTKQTAPPSARAKEIIMDTIIPRLEKMVDDPDVDVRYFSTKSLEEIDELVKQYLPTNLSTE
jgi:serine/threonine-protein phosphatase 2A regulatory subunit A